MDSCKNYSTMFISPEFTSVFVRKVCHTDLIMDSTLSCFEEIMRAKPKTETGYSFTIADFGTSDGSFSFRIINKLIDLATEKYGQKTEITIVFEDQPLNNFNGLFQKIHGKDPAFELKLKKSENVHVLVSGTSMYERCLKANEIDLCICSLALHWLSRRPCYVPHGLQLDLVNKEKTKLLRDQAAEDWINFLQYRGIELRPNGYMVLLILCGVDVNKYVNNKLDTTLKLLYDEKKITKDEFKEMTLYEYLRTENEIRKPFEDKNHVVTRYGLELIHLKSKDYVWQKGLTTQQCKDPAAVSAYANAAVIHTKHWLYSTIYCGLSEQRSSEERHVITEEYFRLLFEHFVNQEKHPDCVSHYVEVIIRKSSTDSKNKA